MPGKRQKPEAIVANPRQGDVFMAQVKPVADAIRSIGGTEVTCLLRIGDDKCLCDGQSTKPEIVEAALIIGCWLTRIKPFPGRSRSWIKSITTQIVKARM